MPVQMMVGSSFNKKSRGGRGDKSLVDVLAAKIVVATAGAFEHAMCRVRIPSCPMPGEVVESCPCVAGVRRATLWIGDIQQRGEQQPTPLSLKLVAQDLGCAVHAPMSSNSVGLEAGVPRIFVRYISNKGEYP